MNKRRKLVIALGASTLIAPFGSFAQQQTRPKIIGFLESGSPAAFHERLAAFRSGLNQHGYVEGKNITIEYRWAEGQYDRLPAFASDLVQRDVAVIVATGSPNTARAAQAATTTIPIVFANGGDPLKLGLVSSLNRPSGNSTGVSFFNSALLAKRIELARDLLPKAKRVGIIVNPNNSNTPSDIAELQAAAKSVGLQTLILNATSEAELDPAFNLARQNLSDVILVNNDAYFSTLTLKFAEIALRSRIPVIYYLRDFVTAGGLISYGTNIVDMYREAGLYAAKILNGIKPADIPVLMPSKFEFIVNLKTAKALGITIPPSVLVRANEVIE